ncbi:hypothetical protein [Ahrensia kielensis]|uniref:hypothetical protein n=1 Tax=Ahrensia kielensis TaxID=76980 RepID=UPI0012EAC178|nr:hypothetical protein [Ahrensia kielensis]
MQTQLQRYYFPFTALAGLTLFTSVEEKFASWVSRVVLGYEAVITFLWGGLSDIVGVDFTPFKNELSLSLLLLGPYIVRVRKVTFGSFIDGKNRLLHFINFIALSIIVGAFPPHTSGSFSLALGVFCLGTLFLVTAIYGLAIEPIYRRKVRLAFALMMPFLIGWSIYSLISNNQELLAFESPYVALFAIFISQVSYIFGIMCKVEDYFPFLFCLIAYAVIWSINYFSLNLVPVVDGALLSIGV